MAACPIPHFARPAGANGWAFIKCAYTTPYFCIIFWPFRPQFRAAITSQKFGMLVLSAAFPFWRRPLFGDNARNAPIYECDTHRYVKLYSELTQLV